MELRDAFDQIHAIRIQLARTERLRSLRAVPVAFSAVLALSAGAAQALWIQEPAAQPLRYLLLWVGAAAISALAAVMEMVHRVRSQRLHVGADTARHAWAQFA